MTGKDGRAISEHVSLLPNLVISLQLAGGCLDLVLPTLFLSGRKDPTGLELATSTATRASQTRAHLRSSLAVKRSRHICLPVKFALLSRLSNAAAFQARHAESFTMPSADILKLAVLASVTSVVMAQAVTDKIAPLGQKAPAGCVATAPGRFEINVIAATDTPKRDVSPARFEKRKECGTEGVLVMSLKDSVAKDALDRTAYIASNFQFQFDGPPQAGAIYTAGFSLCPNGLLALGNSTQFWQCKSGEFWNLYDRNWAAQCDPVVFKAMPCGPGSEAMGADHAIGAIVSTQIVSTTMVRPIADGQPQVITTTIPIAMCQIGDGQVQAHTTPCASITQPLATATPLSQIPDGQVQVPPPAPEGPTSPAGSPPPPGSAPPADATTPTSPEPKTATPSDSPTDEVPAGPTSPPSAPPVGAGVIARSNGLALAAAIAGVVGALILL
ncbi:hypothetical protein RB601_006020 [Gaeumannomyces tritici]